MQEDDLGSTPEADVESAAIRVRETIDGKGIFVPGEDRRQVDVPERLSSRGLRGGDPVSEKAGREKPLPIRADREPGDNALFGYRSNLPGRLAPDRSRFDGEYVYDFVAAPLA